jgi:hypothetical protein
VNRVGTGPGTSTVRLVPDGGQAEAPANFTATPGDGQIRINWRQPNLHGNTLASYEYKAVASTGSVNASSTPQTTHTFTGLDNGTSYRVTVQAVTKDAQGKLIWGKLASRTVTAGSGGSSSSPTLTASRGASGRSAPDCVPPNCFWIKVVGKDLKPDTAYFFQPYTSKWGASNPGATLTTESDGSILIDDRFATNAPGQQVWVVATADGEQPVTSHKFTWSSP